MLQTIGMLAFVVLNSVRANIWRARLHLDTPPP